MNILQKSQSPGTAALLELDFDSLSEDQVETALRSIPSHGWPTGWDGRRRRAALVLSALAHLPGEHIAELIAGDIAVTEDVAYISTVDGTVTVGKADETLLCGPCALARWLHALDLMVIYPERTVAATIARAAPLHAGSPHLCHRPEPIARFTASLPLFAFAHSSTAAYPDA